MRRCSQDRHVDDVGLNWNACVQAVGMQLTQQLLLVMRLLACQLLISLLACGKIRSCLPAAGCAASTPLRQSPPSPASRHSTAQRSTAGCIVSLVAPPGCKVGPLQGNLGQGRETGTGGQLHPLSCYTTPQFSSLSAGNAACCSAGTGWTARPNRQQCSAGGVGNTAAHAACPLLLRHHSRHRTPGCAGNDRSRC